MSKCLKKTTIIVLLILVTVIASFSIIIFDNNYKLYENENNSITLTNIENEELSYCNDLLSSKLNKNFYADKYVYLKDFNEEYNFIGLYDSTLKYFAVYNRVSKNIMERGYGHFPYQEYLENTCYYGNYGAYFYEKDNTIINIYDNNRYDKPNFIKHFSGYSKELKSLSLKEKNNIVNSNNGINVVTLSASNRENSVLIDDPFYNLIYLCNRVYVENNKDPNNTTGFNTCIVSKNTENFEIGFYNFNKYNGTKYYDTIFPINATGTCGITAAAMMLQYYERTQKLHTVADSLYNNPVTIRKNNTYNANNIVSEKLHNAIDKHHVEVAGGSTYTTVANALNDYFKEYSIKGITAKTNLSWWGLKTAIDNSDPCVIFAGMFNLSVLNADQTSYDKIYIDGGHAMYTFGYTTFSSGVVDEYICHTGWEVSNYFSNMAYVSKLAIAGNVILSY